MKTVLLVFTVALVLNLIWEHLHFRLYDCSLGCKVNTLSFLPLPLLLKASLFDAFFITVLYLLVAAYNGSLSWTASWQTFDTILIACIALSVATFIERNALVTHKWAYTSAMPVIPILAIGLSPFLQLAVLAFATYTIVQMLA